MTTTPTPIRALTAPVAGAVSTTDTADPAGAATVEVENLLAEITREVALDWWASAGGLKVRREIACRHIETHTERTDKGEVVIVCDRCGAQGTPLSLCEGFFGHTLANEPIELLDALKSFLYAEQVDDEDEDDEPVDWSEVWDSIPEEPDYLVPGFMTTRSHVHITAGPKVGKSTFTKQLGASMATGRSFLGSSASEPISVLYIDVENDLDEDVIPDLKRMGFDSAALKNNFHFYSFPRSIKPFDTDAGARWLEKKIDRHEPKLVIFDNLQRLTEGEENSNDTMRAWYRRVGMKLKAAGIASIRLDNTGWDTTRSRGASGKHDDIDIAFLFSKRDGDARRLTKLVSRKRGIADVIDLIFVDDRYEIDAAHRGAPDGTSKLVRLLDELGVPKTASFKDARAALTAAKEKANSKALAAAVKLRKNRAEERWLDMSDDDDADDDDDV